MNSASLCEREADLARRAAPPPLPVVLRHALVAMVDAMTMRPLLNGFVVSSGRINAPGFLEDLVRALWAGDITEARRIVRQFGVTAIAPHADMRTVRALTEALDAAFRVVEAHGRAASSEMTVERLLDAVDLSAREDAGRAEVPHA
jgi:hypothetical protein